MAIMEILNKLQDLGTQQFELDLLHRRTSTHFAVLRRAWIRVRYAWSIYFSDMWNVLDWFNFLLFGVVLAIRVINNFAVVRAATNLRTPRHTGVVGHKHSHLAAAQTHSSIVARGWPLIGRRTA